MSADRRPVRARSWGGVRALAGALARAGVSPNAISVSSVVFAGLAGGLLALTARVEPAGIAERLAWLAAAACIGARLFANVLDGLVAVEHDRRSPIGGVMNELPDRVSDVLVFAGLGYASGGRADLGYLAACVALLVAYVRELGAGQGARHHFAGPMAKQHRMLAVVAAALVMACLPSVWRDEVAWNGMGPASFALALIVVLGLVTAARRFLLIRDDLHRAARGGPA